MNKIFVVIVIAIIILTGCTATQDSSNNNSPDLVILEAKLKEAEELLNYEREINKELEENKFDLMNQIDIEILKQLELEEQLNSAINKTTKMPVINNSKYNEPSGLMKYVGKLGIRAYPSSDAPFLVTNEEFEYEDLIVNCRAVISTSNIGGINRGAKWGIVLVNDWGRMKSGYVPYNELEPIDYPIYDKVESLGEFSVGNRIEKMIGVLDRDFTVITENVCMYTFYDFPEENSVVIYGDPSIDAFVTNEFRIDFLRTNSSMYPLKSGYKVGDKALEVIEYYREIYPESNVLQMEQIGRFEFKLSDDEYLRIYIDEDEITDKSIVTCIEIT